MGKKLMGTGFTHHIDKECDVSIVSTLIENITDESLRDEDYLYELDMAGDITKGQDVEHVDFPGYVRDRLVNGAKLYRAVTHTSYPLTADYYIQGTMLVFTFVADGVLGDVPILGFDDLCLFLNLCDVDPTVASEVGYISYGIPDAALVAEWAGKQ